MILSEDYIYYSKQQLDENTVALLASTSPLEFSSIKNNIRDNFGSYILIFEGIAEEPYKTHVITIDTWILKENNISTTNKINMKRCKFYEALVNKLNNTASFD